jgi:hypothetical protein
MSPGLLCTIGKKVSWDSLQCGRLLLFLTRGRNSPMVGCTGECWASVHFREADLCTMGKQVSWCPQSSRLSSEEELGFLLFDGGVGTLLWAGVVGSARPLCTVRRQVSWCPQSGRLPLSTGPGFPLFDGVVGILPQVDRMAVLGLCAL